MKFPSFLRSKAKFSVQSGVSADEIRVANNSAGRRSLTTNRMMLLDPEVYSAVCIRVTAMLPDLRFGAGDSSEEAKRQAEFVTQALSKLPGGALETLSKILTKACVEGFNISEKHWTKGNLPGFKNAEYFENLRMIPAESFLHPEAFKLSDSGLITAVEEYATAEQNLVDIDDIFYFAHGGDSSHPRGFSILDAAHSPWAFKREALQLYTVLLGVNASGMRIGKMDKEEFRIKELRDEVIAVLRGMASQPTLVIPDNMELDIQQPNAVGNHFIDAIREIANKEIRKAIYFDETLSAEGRFTGGYASKQVSEDIVGRVMLKEGKAFTHAIKNYLVIPLLERNSFDMTVPSPVPIPIPAKNTDTDPKQVIETLSLGYSSGVLTIRMADTVQEEIAKRILEGIDVQLGDVIPTAVEAVQTKDPLDAISSPSDALSDALNEASKKNALPIKAALGKEPKGRTTKDRQREDSEFQLDLIKAVEEVQTACAQVTIKQLDALSVALFAGNSWKVTNLSELRKEISIALLTGARQLGTAIDSAISRGWKLGNIHANRILEARGKIKAAAGYATPQFLTEQSVEELIRNRRILNLDKIYGRMNEDVFIRLENLINGKTTPQTAMAQINELLQSNGFMKPGLARTIVDTNYATAYNRSRQNVFSPFEDITGRTPGAIDRYIFVAIIDNVTTDICRKLNNATWLVNDPSIVHPPVDYGCRSRLIPVFYGEELWNGGTVLDTKSSAELAAGVRPGFGSVQ